MLYFIFGRAGSGKTAHIRSLIKDIVENTNETPMLIVPEQYSFESEREMLRLIGPAKMSRVEIFSFSRLARKTVPEYIKNEKPFITDAERAAVMSMCVEQLSDTLEIFGRHINSQDMLSRLVSADTQLRQCRVSPETLLSASAGADDFILKQKMREIALISETYRAHTARKYSDENTEPDELARLIAENNLFEGRVVMFDSFRGFTAQETKVFAELVKRAKDAYVTVCAMDFTDSFAGFGAFTHTCEFAKKLRAAAQENNVRIAKPVYLSATGRLDGIAAGTPNVREAVSALEYSLYDLDYEGYQKETDDITLVLADDKADESEFAAREIRRLVREENMRCRDIYIIERTQGGYKPFLLNALRRFGLPVFEDARRGVFDEPLVFAVYYAIESIVKGFATQSVMRYLKTGLTDVELLDICVLDNYTVVWDIDGSAWKSEWKNHPSGLGYAIDEKAAEKLKKINEIRLRILKPLLKLKEESSNNTGAGISKAVFDFITETGMSERLLSLALEAENSGEAGAVSARQEDWDALVLILEQAAFLMGDAQISLKRYCEIFKLLCDGTTLGVIPQGVDEITVGAADRIRTEDARAVFIVGANDGVFPLGFTSDGIFSETDRKELSRLGVELSLPYEYRAAEERFISYCALTAAREKIYVLYSRHSVSGETIKPSEIVAHIERYFPNCRKISARDVLPLTQIESGESALAVFASHISEDSVFAASLKSGISRFDEYAYRLNALQRAAVKEEIYVSDELTAKELFGRDITLSASKLQSFFECPFSFFCKYGLSIRELRAASLDPASSGIAVHYVLEKILKAMSVEELISSKEETLRERIEEHLGIYLDEMMGGTEGKSKRFLALFYRLSETVFAVVSRLKSEFRAGQFAPVEYELYIGGDKVGPYTVTLKDGSRIRLTGVVDRVDIMERGGKKYLRIIDYKTGKKEFRLSDVIQGIDMQMCLYLMAIDRNGKAYFGDAVPAGVLYLPSRVGISKMKYGRNPTPQEIADRKIESGKLSGMILNDVSVITGMGFGELNGYLPVKVSRNGEITGDLYSMEQLGKLCGKIDKIIADMGNALHSGAVPAYPCGENYVAKACDYCEYSSICGYEDGDSVREIDRLNHAQALAALEEEDKDG